MRQHTTVAAAVAAAIAAGSAGLAHGQQLPTLAQAGAAQSNGTVLYIAGSSAAEPAFAALITNLLGGTAGAAAVLTVTPSASGDTNFFAWSGIPPAGTFTGADGSTVWDIFYRDEGGSVTGVLPIVTAATINQINLNDTGNISYVSGAATAVATVGGSSANNGIDDSFTGGVIKEPVQLGIADVEPAALVGNNYPSAYLTSVYGSATAAQMSTINGSAVQLFDEVYGIFVNNGSTGSNLPAGAIDLSQSSIANVLDGTITNWKNATSSSGAAVTTSHATATVVNREAGSGSRTATDLYFTHDECVAGASHIHDAAGATGDFFSTGNVLAAANTTAGAITYATIDNFNTTKYPNLTLVTINGVQATNINAAQGNYDFWVEATAITNPADGTDQASIAGTLVASAQTIATTAHTVDINAIPDIGSPSNTPSLPVSSTVSSTFNGSSAPSIYINPYTRSKSTCSVPASDL